MPSAVSYSHLPIRSLLTGGAVSDGSRQSPSAVSRSKIPSTVGFLLTGGAVSDGSRQSPSAVSRSKIPPKVGFLLTGGAVSDFGYYERESMIRLI